MKKLLILAVAFFSLLDMASAQGRNQSDPVHWKYTVVKSDTGDNEYELHFTASIDPGWHTYSQTQPKDAVATPTTIKFISNPLVRIKDKPKEVGKLVKWHDVASGIGAFQYANQVDFVQLVQLKGSAKLTLSGSLTYQACTDEMCLPPKTVPISFSLPIN